jgi:threonine/homoserine/homoserine lactone efflux protein
MLFAAQWFAVIRWAGVAYFLYTGLVQWRRADVAPTQIEGAALPGYAHRTFWHGFAVPGLYPKSLLFFAAILPQFLDPTRPPAGQLLVMGATLLALALVTTTLWAFFADCARIMLRAPNDWLWRDRVSAAAMIIAGVALAVAKR